MFITSCDYVYAMGKSFSVYIIMCGRPETIGAIISVFIVYANFHLILRDIVMTEIGLVGFPSMPTIEALEHAIIALGIGCFVIVSTYST